ncbi:MAG TPA: HEPN domain-containing protein [Solirubrobacteraceae bacterium]|nr:HEPN domain-containing protein [Solirubrobacteraceae bacterium]
MSPSPEHVEYAGALLRLADADLHACRVLAAHDDVADGAVGFHAQQAVEKALKVAIVLAEAELPRSHDLEALAEQAAARAPLPDELAGVDWLTPWAVALRYDELTTTLDRAAAVAAAESACRWATALLNQSARDAS